MNFIQKHAGKATKVFVATVVIASASFGAYGLGRAAQPAAKTPKDLYVGYNDNWRDIPWQCNSGCAWEHLTPMTRVTVPAGIYVVTAGGYAHSEAATNQITCEISPSNGGFRYQTYGVLTLDGIDSALGSADGIVNVTGVLNVSSASSVITLRCGVLNEVGSGSIQLAKIFVRAQRVESAKISEVIPRT